MDAISSWVVSAGEATWVPVVTCNSVFGPLDAISWVMGVCKAIFFPVVAVLTGNTSLYYVKKFRFEFFFKLLEYFTSVQNIEKSLKVKEFTLTKQGSIN